MPSVMQDFQASWKVLKSPGIILSRVGGLRNTGKSFWSLKVLEIISYITGKYWKNDLFQI